MFEKILIANRGEIAVRIARTCERMGIATVAVHSDIEKDAPHVQACDAAVCVGTARVQDSYLNQDAILAAAKETGAQAIHPGYGLLSENAAFAQKVIDAGMVFIGPKPETIALFGDKVKSRQLAIAAGARVVPGTDHLPSDMDAIRALAEEVGYPLMVKAAAGGGGIGMLRVDEAADLERAIKTCEGRAQSAFGDGRLFLERFVDRPRHLEIQILGDTHGNLVSFVERECSVQRRHQKVIEESPAPALTHLPQGRQKRTALREIALNIAREVGYAGVGTAEFIMDEENRLYFVEWNPRLQVEHAVTEMCTRLDLVEQQIRVAAGEVLAGPVLRAEAAGHAVEARIYAEDPAKGFLPKPGEIETLRWPVMAPGTVRVESGVVAGSTVTPYYDPMIAKVIAYGPTRYQALLSLDRVLAEMDIGPLTTNIAFLRQVISHDSFRAGQYDTDFVARMNEVV